MKKILVTGACGYLGANICEYLAKAGYSVTAFTSFDSAFNKNWNTLIDDIIIGDIQDEIAITNLAKIQFDTVIHLVSLDHFKSENNPNIVSAINVMPIWNLLYKLTKKGLKRFIYFSTVHVYGDLPSKNLKEDFKPDPQSTYGLTHLLSEEICNYYNKNTQTKCINLRLSNGYGSPIFRENNCWQLVINDLCMQAFNNNKIRLLSDGSPLRDFIHISDICRAIEILIEAKSSMNKNIYHLASGDTLTILELAHIVREVFKDRYLKEINISVPNNSILVESGIKSRFSIDISRMNKFGFQPIMPLKDGINQLFDYLEVHGDR